LDEGGRYIYIHDQDSGAYWSPSWQPTRTPLDSYECRHGMGYTRIQSLKDGLEASIRYFVPLDANLEIWQAHLVNRRDQPARLALFASVEFCLWDALDDSSNFQRNFSTGEVEIEDGVIYHKTEYRERRDHFAYLACSEQPAAFDTQREAFLGPYRGWSSPQAVETGQCSNSVAHGWAPVGVQQVNLTLQPGEERQVIFLLGYHENPKDAKFDPPTSQRINKATVLPVIRRFLQPAEVETAFAALAASWEKLLSGYQADTPDVHTDRMVNIWTAYQCMSTFNMSRAASYFESGIGRGMGFRDSNQDLLGFVHMVPERARQRILDLAATQLPNGGAYHQYQPLTKRGNNDVGSNFNDDPLWLVLAVTAYIKETGDFSILNEYAPYDNREDLATPLYEHLQRSLQYVLEGSGPHGLPLIGRADWNACLHLNCFSDTPGQSFQTTTNKDGQVAESVFIAGLFVLAADEMARLGAAMGRSDAVETYSQQARRMEAVILEHGWDGDWFRRAYDDFGRPLGSRHNAEGQIFIEPQGICVMAGVGMHSGQARSALDAVEARLATLHGIVLQQPAYSHYYLEYGEISSYPPGYKENAGIFCHTNPWIMISEALIGRGDRAYDYYLRINPSAREAISDVHRCEPYVYAQMIAGCDAPTHGEAKNSWLSGTAAWNYVAITQYILGVRPTYSGLQIVPCIPSGWQGFQVQRRFRGVTYHITVERRGPGSALSMVVDGRSLPGNIVPLPAQGVQDVNVQVIIA